MKLTLFFVLFSHVLIAQDTFIKVFDLDAPGGGFSSSILISEDTLAVTGNCTDSETDVSGFYFGKIDTMGNVVSQKKYYAQNEENIIVGLGYDIIQSMNNNYFLTGVLSVKRDGVLLKLNSEGDSIFMKEYSNPDDILTTHQTKITEVSDGFIVYGRKQRISDNYGVDAFVMKIDFDGNKLWETFYNGGEIGRSDYFKGVRMEENTGNIVAVGFSYAEATSTGPNPTPENQITIAYFSITFDSQDGSILNILQTEEIPRVNTDDGGNINSAIWGEDSNYIWTELTMTRQIIPPDPEPFTRYTPRIVKRDTNFNRIWSTPLGDDFFGNVLYDLTPAPDGGYLAAGTQHIPDTDSTRRAFTGFLAKVDAAGNLQWTRKDTVYALQPPPLDFSVNEYRYTSVHVLPSGSIIATGRFNHYGESPARTYGWMIKLDPDGCLTPGCHPNLTGINIAEHMQHIEVFPNPTTDYVTVRGADEFTAEVYDAAGRLVLPVRTFREEGQLDFSDLMRGMYFVNIRSGAHFIFTKKVVKE